MIQLEDIFADNINKYQHKSVELARLHTVFDKNLKVSMQKSQMKKYK